LAAQADVEGDLQQDWNRMALGSDGVQRTLTAINPGRETDRIEVFHRTQRLADEGRAWLEAMAGTIVQHLTREITEPVGRLAATGIGDAARAPTATAGSAQGLSPEVMAQAIEQVLHRHYANWCDEAIPALGGLKPREAITTPAGLKRVKGLLREYEDGERLQSAARGRPVVSYQFLAKTLPLLQGHPHRGLDGQTPLDRWAASSTTGAQPPRLPVLVESLFEAAALLRWPLDGFSTEVHPVTRSELAAGRFRSTGGTHIACVAQHMVDTHVDRAVVITDGDVQKVPTALADRLRRARPRVRVGLLDGCDGSFCARLGWAVTSLPALDKRHA
jgi:hypothetical protein